MELSDVYQKYYFRPWEKDDDLCICLKRVEQIITDTYGRKVYLTKCDKSSPSFAVRDEHLLLGSDRIRFAHRRHVFESPKENADYLGCLNIRDPSDYLRPTLPAIAEAFLKPAHRMTNSARYTMPLLSPLYTPFFGLLPFPSIPYASQTAEYSGFCAQTCMYMILLMYVRHGGGGARGPFTLTCQAKQLREIAAKAGVQHSPKDGILPIKQCKHRRPSEVGFTITGLNEHDMASVLSYVDGRNGQSNVPLVASVCHSDCSPQLSDAYYQAMFSYVLSAIPVIAIVHPGTLWQTSLASNADKHAVVIVGAKGKPWEDGFTIVYHDPTEGPYREAKASVFMEAASKAKDFSADNDAWYVPVFPGAVKVTLDEILTYKDSVPKSKAKKYILRNPRYWSVRLISADRYEESLPEHFSRKHVNKFYDLLTENIHPDDLPKYVWALECFDKFDEAVSHNPVACWYFDATKNIHPRTSPFMIYYREGAYGYVHFATIDESGDLVNRGPIND